MVAWIRTSMESRKRHSDLRIAFVIPREQRGQVDSREALHKPYRQVPTQHTADRIDGDACLVGGRQRLLRLRQQRTACGGESDVAVVADQQRGAKLLLEAADRCGQGRLHDMDPRRGAGEMKFLRDGNEMFQLA
jgi:hypothetical protein